MTLTLDHPPRHSSLTALDRAAQGLGVFSIALGVAELAFPGTIARTFGLDGRHNLVRSYGVREIAAGIGALQPNPTPALWSRVAGDVLDLATLATGRRAEDGAKRRNAAVAMIAVGAITLVDVLVAASLTRQAARRPGETADFTDRSGFPAGIEAARGAAARFASPSVRMQAAASFRPSETAPL